MIVSICLFSCDICEDQEIIKRSALFQKKSNVNERPSIGSDSSGLVDVSRSC